jgi:hypothetical protein
MPVMKKMLLFLLLLLIGCYEAKKVPIQTGMLNAADAMQGEELSNPAIYSNADTAWYNNSQTEFTITTPEQLAGLAKLVNKGNDFKGKTVKLGASIMLNDTADWQDWGIEPPVNEWKPIGTHRDTICSVRGRIPYHVFFSGTFDGSGLAVSGVYVNGQDDKGHGLFGSIGPGGTVKNLGVAASYVKGDGFVGGLAGENRGSIINSYFTGNVIGGSCGVGGLAGYNSEGVISGSHSAGNVLGACWLGGLAGWNHGNINDSYSTGSVAGDSIVGGLAGGNHGNISDSYSTGTVAGTSKVGGFVGTNYNGYAIINSYSTGSVAGDSIAGGFAGWNNGGAIINSYSASPVAGDSITGGFAGRYDYGGTILGSYYDKEAGGQSKGIGEIRSYGAGKAEGKTSKEMKSEEFARSLNFFAGLKLMKAWVYEEGKYPALSSQAATKPEIGVFFAGGIGTEASPYVIESKKQLEDFSWLVNMGASFSGMHVKLGAGIMLNDTVDWKGWEERPPSGEWKPIGSYSGIEAGNRPFSGTFDGGGLAVSGIYINTTESFQGLFGFVDSGGAIKNLGIAASWVKGGYSVGGLAGKSNGIIANSYATARVEVKVAEFSYGGYSVGGLAGESNGIIADSYFLGDVTGYSSVGGLAGRSRDIRNSHFSGTVKGTRGGSVGGLAGENDGSIAGSYSVGKVVGSKHVGGLAGHNYYRSTISGSYFSGDVTGYENVGGLAGFNYEGSIIRDSYSIGNVTGDGNATRTCGGCSSNLVGGIAGLNHGGEISNCYFAGKVAGDKNVGGLAGYSYRGGAVRGSYYDKEAGGQKKFMDGGKAAADMKKRKTFRGWDFDKAWGIDSTVNNGYPYLRSFER